MERGLAENSVKSYRRDLRRYLGYLDSVGVTDLDQVTELVVSGFLVALREGDAERPPLSATSAGRSVVAVPGSTGSPSRTGWRPPIPQPGCGLPRPPSGCPRRSPWGTSSGC